MEPSPRPLWIKTDDLLACLGTCHDSKSPSFSRCRGRSVKKPTCDNKLSQSSLAQISPVLHDILNSGNIVSAITHLKTLALLVLCKARHQTQVDEKVAEWGARIRSFLGLGEDSSPEHEDTRPASATKCQPSTKPARSHEEDVRDIKVKKESEREVKLEEIPALKQDAGVPFWKPNHEKAVEHDFTPFAQSSSPGKINRRIIDKLTKPFTTSETDIKSGGQGYIYGHRLPSNHIRPGGKDCNVVKIGFTNNPSRRMAQWKAKCGYEPQVVFMYRSRHHVKIEKVVHLHLSNERRKEVCPSCAATHMEFFEVDESRAEATVRMWAAWARLGPFDELGELTPYWRQKLECLDPDDPDCWEKYVFDKVK
ncbi:hypothetical protein CTRI78_v009731 [Colletotrichum trifolii]|uniref:Bacteriophage T5 Orf172 DNA-binding domain-containing protein n=1 Tax=Colletotrichum trifolii TaxID=5466 RepID=A0A4R8QXE1_COLTR|nr:hypothetical protein CTRI78_v009731 [Colletotrichum trifolii]